MAFLKSIFISFYLLFMTVVSITAIYVIATTGINPIWFGTLLTALPFLGYLGISMLFQNTPRTRAFMPLITACIFFGFIISVAGFNLGGSIELFHQTTEGLFFSILGTLFYIIYLFWYSKLDRSHSQKLVAGSPLPSFELSQIDGKTISTDDFVGKKALYLFYRGNWCPFCTAQIKELAKSYDKLASMGVQVLMISPQSAKHTQQLAKRFSVPMKFYIDTHNQAAKQLGILAPHGVPKGIEILGYESDSVQPTVIITDETNQIIYCDLTDNYRVRPEPDNFIKAIESAQTS